MAIMGISFRVRSSDGKGEYVVRASCGSGEQFILSCSCPAAKFKAQMCRHRFELLAGDPMNSLLDQHERLPALLSWAGPDLVDLAHRYTRNAAMIEALEAERDDIRSAAKPLMDRR